MAADEFTKAQLRSIRLLMRDRNRTPSARLVGWDLYSRLNRVTMDAWPAEETIATELGLDVRTVRRAVQELQEAGYLKINRQGRKNRYVPVLHEESGAELPLDGGNGSNTGHFCSDQARKSLGGERRIPDKIAAEAGHFCSPQPAKKPGLKPSIADKNVPLSSSNTNSSIKSFPEPASTATALHASEPGTSGWAAGSRSRNPKERLNEHRDDGRVEVEAIKLLSQDGSDGSEILSELHAIDGGQPRLRLLRVIRNGTVSDGDLAAARLTAAKRGQSSSAGLASPQLTSTTSRSPAPLSVAEDRASAAASRSR